VSAAPKPAPKPAQPAATAPATPGKWPPWRMGLAAFVLVVLGALVGVGGAFLHLRSVPAGIEWPVGLVFGLLCAGALGAAGGMYVRSRAGAAFPAVGWTIAVVVLTQPRPEGDVVVGGGGPAFGFMLGGLITQGVVVVLPPYAEWARADRPGRSR
jgi:hypothetical protein